MTGAMLCLDVSAARFGLIQAVIKLSNKQARTVCSHLYSSALWTLAPVCGLDESEVF